MGIGIWVERGLGAFKYLLAVSMMFAGVNTLFLPLTNMSGALGFVYSSRVALIWLGIIFFTAGLTLLLGKLYKSKKWTGAGLMAIYLCYLFATIVQFLAFAGVPSAWVPNSILCLITGALWLRWRFQTAYINPNHFKRDIKKLS